MLTAESLTQNQNPLNSFWWDWIRDKATALNWLLNGSWWSFTCCLTLSTLLTGVWGPWLQWKASVRAGETVGWHAREQCQGAVGAARLGSCCTSCVSVAQLAAGNASATALDYCTSIQTNTLLLAQRERNQMLPLPAGNVGKSVCMEIND